MIFSHLCNQARCFLVDGTPLPLCQRCTGLYVGAAVTALYLAATGRWRRGLPSAPALLLQAAALVTAMLGGLHLLDSGPLWRMLCGLWTGHVALTWLLTASNSLTAAIGCHGSPAHFGVAGGAGDPCRWRTRTRDFTHALLALTLASSPAALMHLYPVGHTLWTAAALAGLTLLALAAIWSLARPVVTFSRRVHSARVVTSRRSVVRPRTTEHQ